MLKFLYEHTRLKLNFKALLKIEKLTGYQKQIVFEKFFFKKLTYLKHLILREFSSVFHVNYIFKKYY